jgi:HEXXH motif-containing protein
VNYFEPSIEGARDLRRAMDTSLWDSARGLLDEAGADVPGGSKGEASGATSLLDYAAYLDLVLCLRPDIAITDDVKAHALAHLRQRLATDIPLDPAATAPRISNYDTDYYTAHQLAQLSRWWDTEPDNRIALTAASDEQYARTSRAIETAMRYLRDAAPAQHGEVETIVRDIVLAKPDGSNLIEYGGASSFGLWGAISINAETQRDWPQVYRQIVHETGHNLLFAIARDEPLVRAEPSVRRPSPLRGDLRPIDGIFHAAYVSAREAVALEALLQWHEGGGALADDEAEIVAEMLEDSVMAFWDCVAMLRSNDDEGPTALGAAVLADCEAFMSENFALEPC